MPKNEDYDDGEDDEDRDEDEDEEPEGAPFDFSQFFGSDPEEFLKNFDPTKLFNNKEFQEIFKDIFQKITKNLPKDYQKLSPEELLKEFMKNKPKFGIKGPIMYGFSLGVDPEGKPIVNPFGNIKKGPPSGKAEVQEVRDPLIEVNEDNDKIIVIAEMPGVTREDIELKATTRSLTISTKASTASIKYFKEIELPSPIDSNYAKARYTNGILEIKLKKLIEPQTDIKID
jgi:HSP20 family protein